ncbi:MAG: hypothetical protein V1748_10695 [Actinomycetota bacterium]
MREEVHVVVMRLLLVVATFGSVMGFNFTQFSGFVILPFLAGVVMAGLAISARKRDRDMAKVVRNRRAAAFQLVVSCLMVTGFLIYAIVESETVKIIGFSIMLGTLLLLASLAVLIYFRARKLHRLSCGEVRESTGIYGHESEASVEREPAEPSGQENG